MQAAAPAATGQAREQDATPAQALRRPSPLVELLGLAEFSAQRRRAERDALDGVVAPTILRRLLAALQLCDLDTLDHSRRVAEIAVGMARHLRWEPRQVKLLEISALLHDMGKIGVPEHVLQKPGRLSANETDLMTLNLRVGVDLLQACGVDQEVTRILTEMRHFDHELASGNLRACSSVHQGARILTVADSYDSLRRTRPFRPGRSHESALEVLQECSGKQFDTNLVAALSRWAGLSGLAGENDYVADPHSATRRAPVLEPQEAVAAEVLSRICTHLYILESNYDGLLLANAELSFVLSSSGAQRLLGLAPRDLEGKRPSNDVLPFAPAAKGQACNHDQLIERALRSGHPSAAVVHVRHPAGHVVEAEVQVVPLFDSHARFCGLVELFRDQSRSRLPGREYRDLRMAASRDPLTGIPHRGELGHQLTQLLERANADQWKAPLSVIFVDIDHFKEINDRFGHAVGDIVLIEFARLLEQETYSGEVVGRYGGEEFVILCPDADLKQAYQRAERLRQAVGKLKLDELSDWALTASFGTTEGIPGDTVHSLLNRADQALYAAKNGGRNQTRFLTADEDTSRGPSPGDPPDEPPSDAFVHVARFQACVMDDMLVHKLTGFLKNEQARLVEVDPGRILMRLGKAGLFGSWGKAPAKQPVDLEVRLGPESPARVIAGRRHKSNRRLVEVCIRARGKPPNAEVFTQRAHEVLREIAQHFMVDPE